LNSAKAIQIIPPRVLGAANRSAPRERNNVDSAAKTGITLGDAMALRVNQDMMRFAIAMAYAGQAVWWNIAFQFLRVYDFLFRRISFGATRLKDRAAVRLCGSGPFEEGLRHVIGRSIEFNHFTDKEINEAVRSGRALRNVYALEPDQEKAVDEILRAR
jgi:hypothetical protein